MDVIIEGRSGIIYKWFIYGIEEQEMAEIFKLEMELNMLKQYGGDIIY